MSGGAPEPGANARAEDPASPVISVIVPVYNGAPMLARCLEAIGRSQGVSWECIVVDDGSTDDSMAVARQCGARVLEGGHPVQGQARARNLGAAVARAPLLCFVDADVVVRRDTLAQFAALFEADADLTAAFGSYDTHPDAPGVLSQYRNLLHHFVHQTGQEEAFTFWTGCGAIRRDAFLALGGFDPTWRSMEDVELGYRLRAAGARIRLAKHIQVTHLKRWTFWGILKTDIRDRALPWTALIVRAQQLPDDLNLSAGSRASALSVFALLGFVLLGLWQPLVWLAALAPLAVLLACNRDLYAFLRRQRGWWFLVRALPMHWLYYAYSTLAFGGGMVYGIARQRWQSASRSPIATP
jgi:cellulose synthase/poly-beta-1,6-N-acetylglucosamine synthase-like glycosyltransferase